MANKCVYPEEQLLAEEQPMALAAQGQEPVFKLHNGLLQFLTGDHNIDKGNVCMDVRMCVCVLAGSSEIHIYLVLPWQMEIIILLKVVHGMGPRRIGWVIWQATQVSSVKLGA